MNRNSESRFNQVPRLENPRSLFDRSHQLLTTINEGDLVPIYCDEVLPGDSARVRLNSLVRMATPIYPIMDNCYMDTYFFFVPCRLLWKHWENMFGQNDTDYWSQKTEYSTPKTKNGQLEYQNGTLADYFGIPTNVKELEVNALPIRAYAQIYNEWFRDENLQAPLMLGYWKEDKQGEEQTKNSDKPLNNPENTVTTNEASAYHSKPCKAAKFHDYFTSCLPYPQKGEPVSVNLSTFNDVPVKTGAEHIKNNIGEALKWRAAKGDTLTGTKELIVNEAGNTLAHGGTTASGTTVQVSNLWAQTSQLSSTGITINELRQAIALQQIFEADARNGTRYREYLAGAWGVTSPDSRMQIPEYIGGQRITINVNQVIQTSASTNTAISGSQAQQAIGNTAAYSLTTYSGEMVDYAATEHGFIIGLAVVRVEHSYQQGLKPMWTRGGRFTYYDPRLANLGEQPVYNREIFAQGTDADNEIFGYQEAWADYRYKPSYITGEMRSQYEQSLDAWHYADDYDTLPKLSSEWIQEGEENVNRTIAVTSAQSHQFLCDFYFSEEWRREMPIYSIPGLERI